MKHLKFFVFLFCVLLCGLSYSQKTHKQFIMKKTDFGMLYFVQPQTICKSKALVCEFDQTIRTWSDTVSIGVSVTTNETIKVDSITIGISGRSVTRDVEHIYVEPCKKKWKCRFFVYVTMEEMERFLSETSPFIIFHGIGNDKSVLVKQKKWLKVQELNKNIYLQVGLNK